MKKIYLVTLMALTVISFVNAQKQKGFAGFLKTGYALAPGSANIFRQIAPQGISGFSNNFFSFGAEGYYRTGRVILTLEGNGGAQGDYSSGNSHAEPFIASGHGKFGWIIMEDNNYWIYPSVGTGTAATAMTTYDKVNGHSRNHSNQFLLSPSFDFGINGDLLLSRNTSYSQRYSSFILGLRAGYRASFRSSNWRDDDGDKIDNMPSYGNNAFYITVAVGWGGFVRR